MKRTSEPHPVIIPSPALQRGAPVTDGSWQMPTDLVLALPTSSLMRQQVYDRMGRGVWARPMSRVFLRVDRYFAEVDFLIGPSLVYALDVWPIIARPAGETGL